MFFFFFVFLFFVVVFNMLLWFFRVVVKSMYFFKNKKKIHSFTVQIIKRKVDVFEPILVTFFVNIQKRPGLGKRDLVVVVI